MQKNVHQWSYSIGRKTLRMKKQVIEREGSNKSGIRSWIRESPSVGSFVRITKAGKGYV